jgi:large subunit ribosomal protein L24
MKIRKGDEVLVVAGREVGKRGRVGRILNKQSRVVIEGLNMVTRHVRAQAGVRQAGRIQQEAALHISNVMLVCNKCSQPGRTRVHRLADGKKVRQCLKCKESID